MRPELDENLIPALFFSCLSHLVVGVIAAAAELVPALGAAEVHAAAFRQSVLEPAVRTSCRRTTQSTEPLFKRDRLL